MNRRTHRHLRRWHPWYQYRYKGAYERRLFRRLLSIFVLRIYGIHIFISTYEYSMFHTTRESFVTRYTLALMVCDDSTRLLSSVSTVVISFFYEQIQYVFRDDRIFCDSGHKLPYGS